MFKSRITFLKDRFISTRSLIGKSLIFILSILSVFLFNTTFAYELNQGNVEEHCKVSDSWCTICDSEITSIAPNTFANHEYLYHLTIVGSEISSLILEGINIQHLAINTNLEYIKLIGFPNLYELDLSQNKFSSLTDLDFSEGDFFRYNGNSLKLLNLSYNMFDSLEFDYYNTLWTTYLEELDISNNEYMTRLNLKDFYNLRTLDVENLSNLVDLEISDVSFSYSYGYQSQLDFSNGVLESVKINNLNNIKYLNFYNNNISLFEINPFSNSDIIETIDLSNNQLSSFNIDGSPYHLSSLRNLYLNDNEIEDLYIYGLNGLEYLHIENNPLLSLGLDSVSSLRGLDLSTNTDLEELSLVNQRQSHIASDLDLSNNHKLVSLNLYNLNLNSLNIENKNHLSSLELSSIYTPSLVISNNEQLERIDNININGLSNLVISHNSNLKSIDFLSFTNYSSLETIDLSHNALEEMGFWYDSYVKKLDLSYNNLTKLDIDRQFFTSLETLDLSNNLDLESLSVQSLWGLKELDISNNTELNNLFIFDIYYLESLDLSTNMKLETIELSALNLIKSLDLSNNNLLKDIFIDGLGVNSLDISNKPYLEDLTISFCDITDLIITNNSNLENIELFHLGTNINNIDLSNNKISYIDLGGLSIAKVIENINLSYNYLTTLDLTIFQNYGYNIDLQRLDVSNNNLESMDGFFDLPLVYGDIRYNNFALARIEENSDHFNSHGIQYLPQKTGGDEGDNNGGDEGNNNGGDEGENTGGNNSGGGSSSGGGSLSYSYGHTNNSNEKFHGSADLYGDFDMDFFEQEFNRIKMETKGRYTDEIIKAYVFAKMMEITNATNIDQADIYGVITRGDTAKMISTYAVKVMKRDLVLKDFQCGFRDLFSHSKETKLYSQLSCQLGLMGLSDSGTNVLFNPQGELSRAEFGTILSRMLWNTSNDSGNIWYKKHLDALKKEGIMTKIENPEMKEKRGRVMLMLMRSFFK